MTLCILTSILVLLTLSITLCSGAILDNVADLNKLNLKFDFIVVGGETFILPLMSSDAHLKAGRRGVLLPIDFQRIQTIRFWCWKRVSRKISASTPREVLKNHRNADVLDIIVPFFAPRATPNTAVDWNYSTTAQVSQATTILRSYFTLA